MAKSNVQGTSITVYSEGDIRRLNPAIPDEARACARHTDRRATIRNYRIVRIERINP